MFKWIALALLLAVNPVLAQEHGKETCITKEALTNRAKSADKNSYVYYQLYGVDVGFEDPVDVIIYSNTHEYIVAAFDKGCYVAYIVMNEEQVLEFLNNHTKKANQT